MRSKECETWSNDNTCEKYSTLNVYVGAVVKKVLDHFDVSVDGRLVKSSEAIRVAVVDVNVKVCRGQNLLDLLVVRSLTGREKNRTRLEFDGRLMATKGRTVIRR